MKHKYFATVSLLAAVPVAIAQTNSYFIETSVDYTTRDADLRDASVNEDNFDFEADFYFGEIRNSLNGHALRELPFTQRASSIGLDLGIREVDDDIDNVVDLDRYGISGLYVEPTAGWYLQLGYVNADSDASGDLTSGIFRLQPSYDGYTLEAGKYVGVNTTVGLAYSEVDYENVSDASMIESGSDTIGVTFQHYTAFTDNTGFSIEGNFYFIDLQVAQFDELDHEGLDSSGEAYGLQATYYPSRELGVGIAYADADDLGGRPYLASQTIIRDGLGVFAEWFATDRFSVEVRYNNAEYDLSDADDLNDPGEVESDSLTFGAAYRF